MKYIASLLVGFTISLNLNAQTKGNDPILVIDYDYSYKSFNWDSIDPFPVYFFALPKEEDSTSHHYKHPLTINNDFLTSEKLKDKALFLLDTINNVYRYNPAYFDTLAFYDAVSESTHTKIGSYRTSLALENEEDFLDLAKTLLYLGVIQTYMHLNAEIYFKASEMTTDITTFSFHVIWHYCTNDCYDPEYDLIVSFDKKSNAIYVQNQ